MNQPQKKDPRPNPVGHAMIEGTLDTAISRFDLPGEIEKLHKEDAWLQSAGPSSKTLVKHPDLRIVLIAMRGKMCMPQHRTGARLSVQTLTGHLRLRLAIVWWISPRGTCSCSISVFRTMSKQRKTALFCSPSRGIPKMLANARLTSPRMIDPQRVDGAGAALLEQLHSLRGFGQLPAECVSLRKARKPERIFR